MSAKPDRDLSISDEVWDYSLHNKDACERRPTSSRTRFRHVPPGLQDGVASQPQGSAGNIGPLVFLGEPNYPLRRRCFEDLAKALVGNQSLDKAFVGNLSLRAERSAWGDAALAAVDRRKTDKFVKNYGVKLQWFYFTCVCCPSVALPCLGLALPCLALPCLALALPC